ncbi:MAG: hypothetical protein CVT95_07415 [Bacteroidetes bacterium HGW-Bacteroidetes-12]|nr:MAG: hypothetical protein CVT95_07415 [Bacteroidetes bacterium HGW-Bacteroidetes-12]
MNKKTSIHYFLPFIVIISFFLSSCIQYKEVKVIQIQRVGVKSFSITEINFFVNIQIENPNNYKISITDGDLDLYIKDKKIGKTILQNKLILPKKSNEIHEILISTPLKDALSGTTPFILGIIGKKNVLIHVQGEIKAKAKGIVKKIPVDFKENVAL